jgi:hypothetical protein
MFLGPQYGVIIGISRFTSTMGGMGTLHMIKLPIVGR